MATKSDKQLVKKATTAALEPWEQTEMEHAQDVKSKETLGVPRITTRGGEFKIDGKALGKKMILAIVGVAKEKAYFVKDYDPSKAATPDCFSFTDDNNKEEVMVAAAEATNWQNRKPKLDGSGEYSPCNGCRHNVFGTAKVGRGKRCKDYRRLLVLSPNINEKGEPSLDPATVQRAEKRLLQVPPASLKEWGSFLTSLKDKTRTGSISEVLVEVELYGLPNGGHGIHFTPLKGLDKETHRALTVIRPVVLPILFQPYPVLTQPNPESEAEAVDKQKKQEKIRGKMK